MAELPSGSYVIRSASRGTTLTFQEKIGIISLELSLVPFTWDVHRYDDKTYTIQIDTNLSMKHAAPASDETSLIADHEYFYTIEPVTSRDDQNIYYVIQTNDGRLFKAAGVESPLKVMRPKEHNKDFLWSFEAVVKTKSAVISSPYKCYDSNDSYFSYSGIDSTNPLKDRFGLKPIKGVSDDDRWKNFWETINTLNTAKDQNNEPDDQKLYRVVFFERHGEAANNLKPVADIPSRDPPLSQKGQFQACKVQAMYTKENFKGGIGIPPISYCSPSLRTMATNTITFASLLFDSSEPTINTWLYDDCREKYSPDQKREHRRMKSSIQVMFPKYSIPSDFTLHDECWPWQESGEAKAESKDHIHKRAKKVLNRIFGTEIGTGQQPFAWITSHSGFIKKGLFEVLDFNKIGNIPNACAIPVICQSILPLDGFYTIQLDYSGDTLYAQKGPGDSTDSDIVLSTDSSTSVWYVECVDGGQKLYTIQVVVLGGEGAAVQPFYWKSKLIDSENQVVTSSWAAKWRLYRNAADHFSIQPDGSSSKYVRVSGDNPTAGDSLVIQDQKQGWIFKRLKV